MKPHWLAINLVSSNIVMAFVSNFIYVDSETERKIPIKTKLN